MNFFEKIKGIFSRRHWDSIEYNSNRSWSESGVDMNSPCIDDSGFRGTEIKESKSLDRLSFDEIISAKIKFFDSLPSLK